MILQCINSGCIQPICDDGDKSKAAKDAAAAALWEKVHVENYIAHPTPFGAIHLTKGVDQLLLGSRYQCSATAEALAPNWEHRDEWGQADLAELAMAG